MLNIQTMTIDSQNQPSFQPPSLNIPPSGKAYLQQQLQSEFKKVRDSQRGPTFHKSPTSVPRAHTRSSSKKRQKQLAFDAVQRSHHTAQKENERPRGGGLDVRAVAREIEIEQEKILSTLKHNRR
jgi:hypothetical protein